jgi:hypothetical protein
MDVKLFSWAIFVSSIFPNTRYLGGADWENHSSTSGWAKIIETPSQQKKLGLVALAYHLSYYGKHKQKNGGLGLL